MQYGFYGSAAHSFVDFRDDVEVVGRISMPNDALSCPQAAALAC